LPVDFSSHIEPGDFEQNKEPYMYNILL